MALAWIFPSLAANSVEERAGLPPPGSSIVLGQVGFGGHVKNGRLIARTGVVGSGKRGRLPFEGDLYDVIGLGNFVDLEKTKLIASLGKSFKSSALSKLFDVDLPAKLSLGARFASLGPDDGLKWQPVGKAALSIRLLDLGASDQRQTGFLRFKAAAYTNGNTHHGFEIDRKISLLNLPSTTLYGNVAYKTNNHHSKGVWKSVSSFGFHQDFKLAPLRFAARIGMTPEGKPVFDVRL